MASMTMRLIVQQGQDGRHDWQSQSHAAQVLRLERGLLTIGRGQDCDLVLQDTQVSRHHAELRRHGDQWFVVDLGSTNGTLVGGAPVRPDEACPVPPGVPVQIGDTQLILEEEPSPPAGSWGSPAQELPEAAIQNRKSRIQNSLVWLARAAVAAGGALLIVGSLLPWIRVEITLPVVGKILDQIFDGLDSGQAGLFMGMAAMALLLVLVDVAVRCERTRLPSAAVGLGQVSAGVAAIVAAGVDLYRYYELGIQEFLGISLIDILSEHLGKEILVFIQFGVYLAAAGLVILIVGGLLRLLSAAWAERAR